MDGNFGAVLKQWRNQRHISQLDLGLMADVSARHISFLETGRSKPSRPMVQHLCETLDIPRTARNGMLNAAGFSAAFGERDYNEDGMKEIREAIDWTLQRHDPYPAIVLDRHWAIVKTNNSSKLLLNALGLDEGSSLLEIAADKQKMVELFENWQEVGLHLIARLRTESAHYGGDEYLDGIASNLTTQIGATSIMDAGVLPAVIPARYRAGGITLSLFSTIAQFGTAEDIALADLRIELMFPADDATKAILLSMAPNGPS